MGREILIANKGMVLTDGETYGKKIYLAEGKSADRFHEITDEQYWELMVESEELPND
jgi:hypothetical protein